MVCGYVFRSFNKNVVLCQTAEPQLSISCTCAKYPCPADKNNKCEYGYKCNTKCVKTPSCISENNVAWKICLNNTLIQSNIYKGGETIVTTAVYSSTPKKSSKQPSNTIYVNNVNSIDPIQTQKYIINYATSIEYTKVYNQPTNTINIHNKTLTHPEISHHTYKKFFSIKSSTIIIISTIIMVLLFSILMVLIKNIVSNSSNDSDNHDRFTDVTTTI